MMPFPALLNNPAPQSTIDPAPLPYFPAFIRVAGKRVVIVGGTETAAAKLRLVSRTEAEIHLVAATPCAEIETLLASGQVHALHPAFSDDLLDGAALVIDAADDLALTRRIKATAKARNVLVNVVDKTAECDFIVPAILDRAPVFVAISTGGCAPALARILRQRLEAAIPQSVGTLAVTAQKARRHIATLLPDTHSRQQFWTDYFRKGLVKENIPDLRQLARKALQWNTDRRLSGPSISGQITRAEVHCDNPYDLPHGLALAIENADAVYHADGVAPAVLSLARRDARVVPLDIAPATSHREQNIVYLYKPGQLRAS